MKITNILRSNQPVFSFEFFPPKSEEGVIQLFETLKDVKKLKPGYISVTYGAGGTTRDRSIEIVKRAKNEIGLESMAHLTCVDHSKQEIRKILDELTNAGIDNVIALRGDPPKGQTSFIPHQDGFRHASELVALIHASYPLCTAVAGYPEGHIESPNKETDWDYLREKVSAGAGFIITQLFFDNKDFYIFERRMREKGVTVPIIPGIMPITNYDQVVRFTQTCGAKIPETVESDLRTIQHDHAAVELYGIKHATQQCNELIAHGVLGIHFYTLNKSHSTRKIVENLRS
ncbi:MAG TPA: methylenetetrahydrofolate reductase [NAD(P)H] [Candidatus Bathyarchaeia archaeon]|nr:methylenetetrahydrofolate reductase [NAD(P)H] [Candidatus Bathyarchaeia archaeon]